MQPTNDLENQTFPPEENAALMQIMQDSAIQMLSGMQSYAELMLIYECALKIVQTKFDVINAEYQAKVQRNPIHSMSSRRKKTASLVRKLRKIGCDMTIENIQEKIHDIAGIRVICAYIDDVYTLAEAITEQDDVELVRQKDYISNPKHNGYRSLHLIIKVPVFFSGKRINVDVEVQLRTIAMDYWASLEHQMKYKNELEEPGQIIERLRICAETLAKTDTEMLSIRKMIEKQNSVSSPEKNMIDQVSKLDIGF